MKKITTITVIMLISAFISTNLATAQITPIPELTTPNERYIVQIKAGSNAAEIAAQNNIYPEKTYSNATHGFAAFISAGQLKKLEQNRNILSISPDRENHILGKPENPGNHSDSGEELGQIIPSGITRIGATPGSLNFTGNGIGVAVVDTGLDKTHLDLNVSPSCFFAYANDCQDDEGHGTHVGGIIAAINNNSDTIGIAPEATLYAVKVLNARGNGYDSDVIAGLDWIAKNSILVTPNIKVVNMSLGREGNINDNPAYHEAVKTLSDMGISIVVAAGNDARLEVAQNIPAAYPEVAAIASTTAENGIPAKKGVCKDITILQDTASYFTSDGKEVLISAPGARRENISNNCNLSSEGILSLKLGGGTTRLSGTSMASPHAAGVAALLYQKNSGLTPTEVFAAIKAGADKANQTPLDSPANSYSFDGYREGVLSAPGALAGIN